MDERSARRSQETGCQLARRGLSVSQSGCARIPMLARSKMLHFRGLIHCCSTHVRRSPNPPIAIRHVTKQRRETCMTGWSVRMLPLTGTRRGLWDGMKRWMNGLPGAAKRLGANLARRGLSVSQSGCARIPMLARSKMLHFRGLIHCCSTHVRRSPNPILLRTAGPYIWHVADLGQCLTLVRDAPNNGHISEAAKPTRIAVPELKRR